jgi:hypothetical protein
METYIIVVHDAEMFGQSLTLVNSLVRGNSTLTIQPSSVRENCGEGQTRRMPARETHSVSKAGCTMACMRR